MDASREIEGQPDQVAENVAAAAVRSLNENGTAENPENENSESKIDHVEQNSAYRDAIIASQNEVQDKLLQRAEKAEAELAAIKKLQEESWGATAGRVFANRYFQAGALGLVSLGIFALTVVNAIGSVVTPGSSATNSNTPKR